MEVADELAKRLTQDVLPELEQLAGEGQRRGAVPREGDAAPLASLAVLLERVSAAMKPIDVSEMSNHQRILTRLPAELSKLCEQVVEGASALLFLPPMMDPPEDCWPWLPQLVQVVARQPPLIGDPDAVLKSRQKVLMLYMSLLTFASTPEQRLGAAGFGLAQSLTALASQTLQQAVQLALAKLADLDRVRDGSPVVWHHHESAILATVDMGMQAARFLEVFGQQWREAMREQGVEGLAGAQGVLEALVELLEYLVAEIDWLKTSNLHAKLHQLAATALATTFDPWAECLPPHDTTERAQYQLHVAPLMLRLASSLSEAANEAIGPAALPWSAGEQASEEIPEPGVEQHGSGADASSTQAPYAASVPPGSRSPSQLASAVSLGEVVSLAEGAVRYMGKAREVLRLAPAVPHLEERLAEGVGHLTGVLTALLDDALGTVQTTALPAEAVAELLPALKGLLASCCKLAALLSQAGSPLLLDEQHLPRLGWLVVRAAHLVVEVLLLKAGAAPQVASDSLDNGSLKERMRQDLGVLEEDAADMARYVTQLGRLGVLDEAARAGLGELLATDFRLHLRVLSAASILLKAVCTHLDKTSAQPGLMPTFSRILPDIPNPDLVSQPDPVASMAPYQAALQPGPWQQVQAELLPQLQEVCKEHAASVEAAEPQIDGICRDLALSSFTCCAASCTNLAGMSDLEVDLSKCTGCRAARYCSSRAPSPESKREPNATAAAPEASSFASGSTESPASLGAPSVPGSQRGVEGLLDLLGGAPVHRAQRQRW
ncbi:hypothetical protein N2152v2_005751 [Parachlorella kessleri]